MSPIMQTHLVHPSAAELENWTAHRLDPAKAAEIEAHLEHCDVCARRLDALPVAADPLVDRLRAAAGIRADRPASPPTEANLLFGALALQAGLVTPQQLADGCVLWASRGDSQLADLMVANGWIDEASRASVMSLVEARLGRERGQASLAETVAGRAPDHELTTDTWTDPTASRPGLVLKELHSEGGIGQVWKAFDPTLGRSVALKELLPELRNSRVHRERFFREARVASQLAHPGTAPIYEYREEGGRCYYTMKFLSGRTFTQAVQEAHLALRDTDEKAAAFERLFPLLEQFLSVCDTVAYAHAQGIIHRDLKGDNIIVGEFGEVNVIDWGLAKSLGEGPIASTPAVAGATPTLEGERLGTPAFMAPEQARGDLQAIDRRTDVYGLAAVLYQLLTNRPPFDGATANEIMHRVEVDPPTPPSDSHPETPRELEAVCLQSLSKDPADRHQSAQDLRDAVRNWLSNQIHQREEAERQAKFFSLSEDLFVALDHRGCTTQVNPAYLSFFNRDPGGEHYVDRLHPDDVETANELFREVQQGRATRSTVLRCLRGDGEYRAVNWSVTSVPGESTIYAVGRPLEPVDDASIAVEACVS